MIKLMFEKQGQFFLIVIENKIIKYHDKFQDKLWGKSLQYLPPDPKAIKQIEMSRNRIPAMYKELLKITPEELKEFNEAKDDNELKDLVMKDCRKHNCKLIDMKIQ